MASSRPCGEVVRGSSTRCNVGSRDVTETLTAAASHAASSRKISISRVTRWFFVMIATGLRNLARTSRRLQLAAQEFRRISFDHDFALEIEASRKPEILVSRPRVTIDATVFAPPLRIQARFKADIRTGIPGDNRSRSIAKILRRTPRCLFGLASDVDYVRVS